MQTDMLGELLCSRCMLCYVQAGFYHMNTDSVRSVHEHRDALWDTLELETLLLLQVGTAIGQLLLLQV